MSVQVGQVWAHKREPWRRLTITGVDGRYVDVDRNTSRRRQAVLLTTLHRHYVLRDPAVSG